MYNGYNGYNNFSNPSQPYAFNANGYNGYSAGQAQPSGSNYSGASNTNMIFVGGVDDVRNRFQTPNSTMMYLDNDKPLLYKKSVDNKGQFQIETFSIAEYKETPSDASKSTPSIDLSGYAKTSDLESISEQINQLKEQVETIKARPSIQSFVKQANLNAQSQNSDGTK